MTYDKDSQAAMTPDDALQALLEGNRRFRKNQVLQEDARQSVEATSSGQWPIAVVLSCIDSRTAPELILDQGIGDIFCARIAGNFVNEDILGSLEFGCQVAGAKLVLVMGHERCGAVMGACDDVQLGNLTSMLGKLKPAVTAVAEPSDPGQRTSANPAFVQAVANRNVELTLAAIREDSPVLSDLEQSGTIRIVGAMYDTGTGAVNLCA